MTSASERSDFLGAPAGMRTLREYDYIIIGSGIAGLYDALIAHEAGSVLVLTKGSIDECNTRHAQGGIEQVNVLPREHADRPKPG